MSYVLRVGDHAMTSFGGAAALPIEGGWTHVDGDVLHVLLSFSDPTDAERRSVERGLVELGVFADGGCAALLVRVGAQTEPERIEVKAPLNLLDHPARCDGYLARSRSLASIGLVATRDGATWKDRPGAALSANLALCDSDTGVVQAVRAVELSARVAEALCEAGRAQVATYTCPVDVEQAVFRATRALTVDELMTRAIARCCQPAR